jgi:hypothetical protein
VLSAIALDLGVRVMIVILLFITFFLIALLLRDAGHDSILSDAQLITSSLWQVHALYELFSLVFEFSARIAWFCKICLQLASQLPKRLK